MAQPTPYDRQASFTTIQQAAPSDPLPGSTVDAELNAVKQTLDETLANLALIQRDDGALANGSVGRQQLDASIDLGFNAPSAWHADTNYTVLDTVFDSGKFYRCLVSHLSSVFADDLAAGKWELIADFAGALNSAVNIAVTPSGHLASTDVQGALEELQGDIDTINADPMLATPAVAPSTPASTDNSTKVATTAYARALMAAVLPAGLGPLPWAGLSEPTGWVFANGQTLSRATYPELWAFASAEITAGNSLWGSGDGSTTFTVPSLKGLAPIGKDDMGGTAAAGRITSAGSGLDGTAFGAIGGAETHSLTGAENGPHNHVFTGTAMAPHAHQVVAAIVASTNLQGAGALDSNAQTSTRTTTSVSAGTPAGTISSAGSGTAHNNVQPSIVLNYIIYTGKLP